MALAQQLIRCAVGDAGGCGGDSVLESELKALGFACHRLRFEERHGPIENLYARIGTEAPNFCFAGHTDVVPPGEGWSHDPFAAESKTACSLAAAPPT